MNPGLVFLGIMFGPGILVLAIFVVSKFVPLLEPDLRRLTNKELWAAFHRDGAGDPELDLVMDEIGRRGLARELQDAAFLTAAN